MLVMATMETWLLSVWAGLPGWQDFLVMVAIALAIKLALVALGVLMVSPEQRALGYKQALEETLAAQRERREPDYRKITAFNRTPR